MSEMVERVATAIHRAMPGRENSRLHSTPATVLLARAAIAAMRAPLLDAISKVVSSRDDLGQAHFEEIRGAIDAALKEGP